MQHPFLATPGPVNVHPNLWDAVKQNIHHRSPEFITIMKNSRKKLSQIFDSPNAPILISSSGTGVMEMAFLSVLSPEDKVIVLSSGKFGERFADIGKQYQCNIIPIISPYGNVPDPLRLAETLALHPDTKLVTACHCETSTGALAPIHDYAEIIAHTDALFLVDGISSVGGIPIAQQKNNIDIIVASGHKCLGLPTGLGIISHCGEKITTAWKKASLPKFYFNLEKEFYAQEEGNSQWTPPIQNILALNAKLDMMLKDGYLDIYKQQKQLGIYSRKRAESLGLLLLAQEYPSDTVSAFLTNQLLPPQIIIEEMKKQGIIIVGGQGSLKDEIIRIGHMGGMTLQELAWIFDTLELCIKKSLHIL